MEKVVIRSAVPGDAARMLEIYAGYVQHTAISFEYVSPTLEVFLSRIAAVQAMYPWLALEVDGRVMGYAYAGRFHGRAAFDWDCETTIYLDPEVRGRGLGRRLYGALEAALRGMGVETMYALIAFADPEDEHLTNASARFHTRMGYQQAGRLHRCGYKFGRWYDMLYMEKAIGKHGAPVARLTPYRGEVLPSLL